MFAPRSRSRAGKKSAGREFVGVSPRAMVLAMLRANAPATLDWLPVSTKGATSMLPVAVVTKNGPGLQRSTIRRSRSGAPSQGRGRKFADRSSPSSLRHWAWNPGLPLVTLAVTGGDAARSKSVTSGPAAIPGGMTVVTLMTLAYGTSLSNTPNPAGYGGGALPPDRSLLHVDHGWTEATKATEGRMIASSVARGACWSRWSLPSPASASRGVLLSLRALSGPGIDLWLSNPSAVVVN